MQKTSTTLNGRRTKSELFLALSRQIESNWANQFNELCEINLNRFYTFIHNAFEKLLIGTTHYYADQNKAPIVYPSVGFV